MISIALFVLVSGIAVRGDDYYFSAKNVTRSSNSGMQAYRSALTLDWLASEDTRQRQMVASFETEAPATSRLIATDCINHPRPSSGKVAKLMLELLKNLEGDDGVLVPRLISVLVKSKLLVETAMLDAEPDLDSLVKTPTMMMGEPHVTFPRILAIVWMLVTDATTTRTNGWCPVNKVNEYLATTKPTEIAKHMRMLEPVLARARYIMEEFIQRITPLNIYSKKLYVDRSTQISMQVASEESIEETEKWSNSSEDDSPQRALEEPEVEMSSQGGYEAKMPRAKEDEPVSQENKYLDTMETFEPEFTSTQFLEQAQQVAKVFEDIAAESKASLLKNIIYLLTFSVYILLMLL